MVGTSVPVQLWAAWEDSQRENLTSKTLYCGRQVQIEFHRWALLPDTLFLSPVLCRRDFITAHYFALYFIFIILSISYCDCCEKCKVRWVTSVIKFWCHRASNYEHTAPALQWPHCFPSFRYSTKVFSGGVESLVQWNLQKLDNDSSCVNVLSLQLRWCQTNCVPIYNTKKESCWSLNI